MKSFHRIPEYERFFKITPKVNANYFSLIRLAKIYLAAQKEMLSYIVFIFYFFGHTIEHAGS